MSNAKVYVIHENIEWTQHLVKWLEKYKYLMNYGIYRVGY